MLLETLLQSLLCAEMIETTTTFSRQMMLRLMAQRRAK
jgi:hypothetical protein